MIGSSKAKAPPRQSWRLGSDGPQLLRIAVLVPVCLLVAALLLVTLLCAGLMSERSEGVASAGSEAILLMATGGFLLVSAAVVVVQAMRVAHRVGGPEYRMIQTLRQVRSGDMTWRVHLRRGDLLRDLADECNELIEWLNQNPPRGATVGGDLVEIDVDASESECLPEMEVAAALVPQSQRAP
jgi:hypothetical protein